MSFRFTTIPVSKGMTVQAAIFALLCAPALVVAHPGHSHEAGMTKSSSNPRIWTDAANKVEWQGNFVAANDEQVQIRCDDQSLVRLDLANLIQADRDWVRTRIKDIRQMNKVPDGIATLEMLSDEELDDDDSPTMRDLVRARSLPVLLAQLDSAKARLDVDRVPDIAQSFAAFVKINAIRTRWDDQFFYVESNGIPDHTMMVGITSWQQQVPLPQSYFGKNAWQIPLKPVPAKTPVSAKNRFLRGAIAIAANGIPIFNPLNNRGDDALLFGELDEFGGHCGRADDYHYHIAPVHLEKTIGKGLPIAYALDGYPIYGYDEADGSQVKGLDELNGHTDRQGRYHYHATKTYPYLNGGFHGVVTERGGQVDPQPRAEPIRPDGRPLRDAKVTEFTQTKPGAYKLTYEIKGKVATVSYVVAADGSSTFAFVDVNGRTTTESHSPKGRGPGGNDRRPPPRNSEGPPPNDNLRKPENRERDVSKTRKDLPQLVVTSSAVDAQGKLSAEFTCDGAGASPPVEWSGAPAGTKCLAISLWHIAPDQEKSYWIVYNIPADKLNLGKNDKKTGTMGMNDKRRAEYDPMCSKGPGVKTYHITVYALSAELKLAPEKANRANLLAAIKDNCLAEGTLDFLYERKK